MIMLKLCLMLFFFLLGVAAAVPLLGSQTSGDLPVVHETPPSLSTLSSWDHVVHAASADTIFVYSSRSPPKDDGIQVYTRSSISSSNRWSRSSVVLGLPPSATAHISAWEVVTDGATMVLRVFPSRRDEDDVYIFQQTKAAAHTNNTSVDDATITAWTLWQSFHVGPPSSSSSFARRGGMAVQDETLVLASTDGRRILQYTKDAEFGLFQATHVVAEFNATRSLSPALHQDMLVVGDASDDQVNRNAGAVYVYQRESSSNINHNKTRVFVESAKLLPRRRIKDMYFGGAVALSSKYIVVGAKGSFSGNVATRYGEVYVYSTTTDDDEAFPRLYKILPPIDEYPDRAVSGQFGSIVAIDKEHVDTILVRDASLLGNSIVHVYKTIYNQNKNKTRWDRVAELYPFERQSSSAYGRQLDIVAGRTAVVASLFHSYTFDLVPVVVSSPSPVGRITGFTLVNARTNQDIHPFLVPGQFVDGHVVGKALTVRADVVSGVRLGKVGSVVFHLNDDDTTAAPYGTENVTPFMLGGDNPKTGNMRRVEELLTSNRLYFGEKYTILATPYSGKNGTGVRGNTVSFSFFLAKYDFGVESFTLLNADTGSEISLLEYGTVLSLTEDIGTTSLTVRANTYGAAKAVRFALQKKDDDETAAGIYTLAEEEPFILAGNKANSGDLVAVEMLREPGVFIVAAYATQLDGGFGVSGARWTIEFELTL